MSVEKDMAGNKEFREAFLANERRVRINTGKLACLLVFFLMPLGGTVDALVYPGQLWYFMKLRLLCSMLIAGVWLLHYTRIGLRSYPIIGLPIVILPAFFLCWMMYKTQGAASPYYAALNLILLAVSAVGHWSVLETLLAVGSVLCLYFGVHLAQGGGGVNASILYNNAYFIALTGIIVTCGNYLFNRLRAREFFLTYELDKSRLQLQTNNQELESAMRQLKETEVQLVQAEKMASLGRLSAGIIHEINNPLNAVKTGLYAMRKKASAVDPARQAEFKEILGELEERTRWVEEIVSRMRMYCHPSTEILEKVEVSDIVSSALTFTNGERKDCEVQVEQSLQPGQTIRGNKNMLIQVLLNLLHNSLDALKTKTFANGTRPTVWITGRVENGKSILTVRDNGPGIDKDHLDKVFDPFFTTKDVGQGMGLGLAICYRMVQELEGTIHARSERGSFCEFSLEFPDKG